MVLPLLKGGVMTDLSDLEQTDVELSEEYEQARKRVERKRKFRADLVAYVVINAFLIGVWAASGMGYFWPAWVLAGWGVLLVLDAWNVFYRRPVTSTDIENELRRGR
jgi:fatty acid desaturase